MKVFISYSTAMDQIIALRLQTMAAVYGMTIYVPPATTRHAATHELMPDVLSRLNESDVVLAIITHKPVPSALSEVRWARAHAKLLIPIIGPDVPEEYYLNFQPYFLVDLVDPSTTERKIVHFLAEQQQAQKGKTALIALAMFATILLLWGADSN